jgi:TatD DNase family protein
LIDSHAHLTSDALFSDIESVLARAKVAGIDAIINICTNASTLERGLALAKKFPWIYNAAATTPHDVEKEGEALFSLMEHHALSGDLVAVGETGLDYHYYSASKEIQKHFLKKYLHLARTSQLPVIIHCREAFEDLFQIVDKEYLIDGSVAKGVLHCFTGTASEAEAVLLRGWYLSLSGIVTFKKSSTLRDIAKLTPLNQLLVETDSPYLAPQSQRSKLNEPSFLQEIIQTIAEVKGILIEEVINASANNARTFFKLKISEE